MRVKLETAQACLCSLVLLSSIQERFYHLDCQVYHRQYNLKEDQPSRVLKIYRMLRLEVVCKAKIDSSKPFSNLVKVSPNEKEGKMGLVKEALRLVEGVRQQIEQFDSKKLFKSSRRGI